MPVIRWLSLVSIVALLCASCAATPTPTPVPAATPAPAGDFQPRAGAVRAAAKVTPARKAELSFPTAGRVQSAAVAVGDVVAQGEVLIVVEQAAAMEAVVQARGALFRAQAALAELRAGARPQEIAAAQANVDALQARLDQLREASRPAAIAAARAELAAAQAALQQYYAGPSTEERIAAKVELANAQAALRQAQAAFDQVASRNDVGMLPESRALQQATNNMEAAQARYNALSAEPNADLVAGGRARVQQAQAALDQQLNPASPSQIAEAQALVRSAAAELDLLQAGTREEALAAAAIAVTEAQATLQRVEADLANTALHTPISGTVTALAVNVGEMVQPGEVVATVADLAHLRVETTDLSERDVARVAVGQPATVFVEPLNADVPGHVAQIAPAATIIGGDVVYAVVIELDEQPAGLRWGMTVQVEIAQE